MESSQTFAAVGRSAHQPGDPAFLGRVCGLGTMSLLDDLVESGRRAFDFGRQLDLLPGHAFGISLKIFRVAALSLILGLRHCQPHPLIGQTCGSPQSFAQAGKAVPSLLRH